MIHHTEPVKFGIIAFAKLCNALGENRTRLLLGKGSAYQPIPLSIKAVSSQIDELFNKISRFEQVLYPESLAAIEKAWWFDEDFLGSQIEKILQFFKMTKEYQLLPRGRGAGVEIERWVSCSGIQGNYAQAKIELQKIAEISGRWFA